MTSNPVQPLLLKDRVVARQLLTKEAFSRKHPKAQDFFQEKGVDLGRIRQHSSRLLTTGALAGVLLISPPKTLLLSPVSSTVASGTLKIQDFSLAENSRQFLTEKIKEILPKIVCPLSLEQEKEIGLLVEKLTGIRVRATLEGEHLNTCFGLIGAEQHLPRFPGDSVSQHSAFQDSGITSGRGAWGYFADSRESLQKGDVLREKYYVAVQTLYLPDWEKRLPYLRDWYKYRKVLVLNPENGQAVVAVIADAGPAAWTGKHFGGSPEVMYALGLHAGSRKGAVFLLFVDDPENKIPLGSVEYGKINIVNI